MTAIESDIVSASSWSWVTYTNVIPTSRWMCFSSSCICLRSCRSSAPSGSSSSSTAGRLTSARASATRWRWPPESWRGLAFARSARRTSSSISPTRRVISAFATFLRRRPKAMLSNEREVLEERVALEHRVDVAAVGRHVLDRLALEQDVALVGLLEAGDHAQRRRLAAARRPEDREERALARCRGRGRLTAYWSPKRLTTPRRAIGELGVAHSLRRRRRGRLGARGARAAAAGEPGRCRRVIADHRGADGVDLGRDADAQQRVDAHRQRRGAGARVKTDVTKSSNESTNTSSAEAAIAG